MKIVPVYPWKIQIGKPEEIWFGLCPAFDIIQDTRFWYLISNWIWKKRYEDTKTAHS